MSFYNQSDNVKVSGDYLYSIRNGCDKTNGERFSLDPSIGRTDFLITNDDGKHAHISVDEHGNLTTWHGYDR